MSPPTKKDKLSREDALKKKREVEKDRLARIRSDPIKLAEYKEKQRLQYLKKKEKGQRKSVEEMTPREQRITRKKWKKYSSNYRQKQSLNRTTNNFIHQHTPSTTDDERPPIVSENDTPIMNLNERAKEAKKRSIRQREKRNKQLRKMKAKILTLKTKLNTQRQKYKRAQEKLKKTVKSSEKTLETRIKEMSADVTKRKELAKKALFGEVIKIQLEENYAKIKSHKKKESLNKLYLEM